MARNVTKVRAMAATRGSVRLDSVRVREADQSPQPYFKLSELSKSLEPIFEIAETINSSLDHNTIIQTGLIQLKRFLKADSWTIFLTETEHRRTELNRLDSGQHIQTQTSAFPAESLLGQTLRSGKSTFIKDVSRLKVREARYDKKNIASVLCLPLMSRGHAMGVIEATFGRQQSAGLKEIRINFAQRAADLIATSLHNATLYADVEHLCLIDDLTRLYNIRFLRQSLEAEIRRAKRYHSSVALIFLDLDGFKRVNDAHGHLIGSATLVETARIIYSMVRDTDFVARYGGDEFVIILPETSAQKAAQIAERIRQGIQEYGFSATNAEQFRLTASFGVAAYPEHGMTSQELIQRADAAMYTAKEASKNAVALAF